mgnify:CR=1 FL=1
MPQPVRKSYTICKKCKTRYAGDYCPYCGAEGGFGRVHRGGGLVGGLLQFVFSLIFLALIVAVAFIILDYSASANGDASGAARAILDSLRNAIPKGALDYYAAMKSQYLDRWVASIVDFFHVLFS